MPAAYPMLRRVAWLLGAAGAIPFAVATAALLSPESRIRVPAVAAMVTYAAVVLSFLGGIEWGVALHEPAAATPAGKERHRITALLVSVVPSLAAWLVLTAPPPSFLPSLHWQLGADLALFVLVWAADLAFARQGLLPTWFVNLRTAITAVVVMLLGLALYLL